MALCGGQVGVGGRASDLALAGGREARGAIVHLKLDAHFLLLDIAEARVVVAQVVAKLVVDDGPEVLEEALLLSHTLVAQATHPHLLIARVAVLLAPGTRNEIGLGTSVSKVRVCVCASVRVRVCVCVHAWA